MHKTFSIPTRERKCPGRRDEKDRCRDTRSFLLSGNEGIKTNNGGDLVGFVNGTSPRIKRMEKG